MHRFVHKRAYLHIPTYTRSHVRTLGMMRISVWFSIELALLTVVYHFVHLSMKSLSEQ